MDHWSPFLQKETMSYQSWICLIIVVACIVAYLIIGCIPWDCLCGKRRKRCEPFNCPVNIIGDLCGDRHTSKVFRIGKDELNRTMLTMYSNKFYGDDVSYLGDGKEHEIFESIKKFIKDNRITTSDEFMAKVDA